MHSIASFPAIAEPNAKILVLGSVPGTASLEAGQYYAHPRNQFWPIISALLGIPPDCDYQTKVEALTNAGIALWDVVKTCQRPGSMDASISKNTIIVNDFVAFLNIYRDIRQVYFNGNVAEQTFRKYASHLITERTLLYKKLPSTSPAHASLTFEQKLNEWRQLLG